MYTIGMIGILVLHSLNLLVLFTVAAHQVMERKALSFFLGKITWNQRGSLVIYWDYENGKKENYEYHMVGF